MRRWWVATVLAGVLVTTAGCASVFRAPGTIERMDAEIQALRAEQTVLRQKIEELRSAQQALAGMARENHADYQTRLTEIAEMLSTLQAQLEEVTRRSAARRESPAPPPAAPDTSGTGAIAPPPGERPDPNRLYETAYLDVNRRNYALAIEGFRTYLNYYPDTELADNAQYWIGESYFALDDFAAAAREFQMLLDRYPKGDKAAAGLLKLGDAHQRLGDGARARSAFERLTKEFPKTEESRLAKERLANTAGGKQ